MPPLTLYHPATLIQLSTWSTFGRNEIAPLLSRFGIKPLGKKYPMMRIYREVLGLDPADTAEALIAGAGLMRVGEVAERFGVSDEHLLGLLRRGKNDYPPLYAYGPRRHLMLRVQVEQMLSSPRNAWPVVTCLNNHALPKSRLAAALGVPQAKIKALLENKKDLPAHILTQGVRRFILADVAKRLKTPPVCQTSAGQTSAAPPSGAPKGLFAGAAQTATQLARTSGECT